MHFRVGRELSRSNIGHENVNLIKEQQKETRKVIKILRLVVTAFAVLVLPIHLLYVWIDFYDGCECKKFLFVESWEKYPLGQEQSIVYTFLQTRPDQTRPDQARSILLAKQYTLSQARADQARSILLLK